jgi:uncharacterized protein involved in exopolysaccharide biosynthesis
MASSGYQRSVADAVDLRDYWLIIRKRRLLIGAFSLGAVAFTALIVF